MWTVSAIGRAFQRPPGRRVVAPVPAVRPLSGPRRVLVGEALGAQCRGGARLDQVDGTTCASAVLVALAAWADPEELARLDARETDASGAVIGFADRYDARQREVHRQTNRYWPLALGTSPWGFLAWLREHAPAAGEYTLRFVDDRSAPDVDLAIREIEAALGAWRPVPLLVGSLVPRHYCLALRIADDGRWRVYEPGSGEVRAVPPADVRSRTLAGALGFNRLHAAFLPQ